MTKRTWTRRDTLAAGGSVLAGLWLPRRLLAQGPAPAPAPAPGSTTITTTTVTTTSSPWVEVTLVDEPPRGEYGVFDVDNFGPLAMRAAKRNFVFPADVDVPQGYGIDVSHYSANVPWTDLQAAQISYVYIKASQSNNGRDDKFTDHWRGAGTSRLPYGAYHFLTAGVAGGDQGAYFVKRLGEVGGLVKGQLQPVIDLEWDTFGPEFKRTVVGQDKNGHPIYKDYWDDLKSKPGERNKIVDTVNQCADAIRKGTAPLAIKPIIYTNRSWWQDHIPTGTVFPGCTIWISDYRDASYASRSPRSVPAHDYYLWQFTDQAQVQVGARKYGPYDANKLVFGGIDHITIA